MSLSQLSDAVYYYLLPENANITNYGTLYQALPKVANEQDLFTNTFPGLGMGATVYMLPTSSTDTRIAMGGQHDGRKWVEYVFSFLIVFKSDATDTVTGQLAYSQFISDFTAWIRADRNAWTEGIGQGGRGPYGGTGIVFQMGEGGVNGGPDLQFRHFVPRTLNGGVTIYQGTLALTVTEALNT